jgi:hypothetical protein
MNNRRPMISDGALSMRWFGARHGAPYEADSDPVATPVGARCFRCDEAIAADDDGIADPPMHYECFFRGIVGGLNHQLRRCTCCGGTHEPDPPDMTRRQAARAATEFWHDRWLTRRLRGA